MIPPLHRQRSLVGYRPRGCKESDMTERLYLLTYGKKRRRTKEPLGKSERREWKVGLKLNIQNMKIMASSPITSWQIDGEIMVTVTDFIFLDFKLTVDGDCSHEIRRVFCLGRKAMTNLNNQKQRHYFAYKGSYSQSCGFSSIYEWMWEMDNKKGWAPKNWCLRTVVLEKMLESSLDFKEIKPVNPKRNQSWIFIKRTDAEAEAPILCPPDVRSLSNIHFSFFC